jgi:uncharacterized protein YfaS (alpha-2-macroglobulin family)
VLGLLPEAEDLEIVRQTLASIPQFQNGDGGFSLWPDFGRSSPYLAAFALLVNNEAKALGLSISPASQATALRYIEKQLQNADLVAEQKAMLLWALAAGGERESAGQYLAQILTLAEKSSATNPMAWGALLHAVKEIPNLRNADSIKKRILLALEKSANITPTQLHFTSYSERGHWLTMGSTLRDNGLVLGALALNNPDYPRLEALAHWVSQGLGEKKIFSTQEAIFGLWGLGNYLQSLGGNKDVTMLARWAEGALEKSESFSKLIEAPRTWTLTATQLANPSSTISKLRLKALEGRPYWTARLRYASPTLPVEPENAGFTITRAWLTPGPWKLGEVVDLSVTIVVPATRRQVLLYDPFPAGLEPLHASRVDIANEEARYQYPWQWQEAREDGMLLYAEEIQPGTYTYSYQLRAAASGVFTRRPSRVEEMYTPEVFGSTNTEKVEIK